MNILLRSVKIIDPQGKHNQQVADIYIKNGIIENIDPEIGPEKGTQIIEIPGLHVSPGWFDSSVSFGEPGFEERETKKEVEK